MLNLLRPFFRHEWAQYGESLQLADSARVLPSVAQWLLEPAHLEGALTSHARTLSNARERKAVASDWMTCYCTALLPPIVALTSLLRHTVPASSHDMTLMLNESGAPTSFAIPHLGTALPEVDTAVRYHALVWEHLDPLIARLNDQVRVPTRILWGNARRTLLSIFGQAAPLVSAQPTLAASLNEDCSQLLESPVWSDGRRNPLFLRHRQVSVSHDGNVQFLTLHASCCLAYKLPHTAHCSACPLAPKHRPHDARENRRNVLKR